LVEFSPWYSALPLQVHAVGAAQFGMDGKQYKQPGRCFCEKYINIPSEKYTYMYIYVYICVYTYLCKMDEYRYYAGLS